ncbi:MAG: hypothetical protein ACTHJ0_16345 [Flavipsychrobacter sp.]
MEIIFGLGNFGATYAVIFGPAMQFMLQYFVDKHYGNGCISIVYRIFCNVDILKIEKTPPTSFFKKEKQIACYIDLDFKVVETLSTQKSFMNYVANTFLSEALDFKDLDIADFNVDAYVKDLEMFFKEFNSRFNDSDEIQEFNYI